MLRIQKDSKTSDTHADLHHMIHTASIKFYSFHRADVTN